MTVRHRNGRVFAGAAAAAVAVLAGIAGAPAASPLDFFDAAVRLHQTDRVKLDAGEAIVKVLPARDRELAVFVAVRTTASAERLAAWSQRVEAAGGRYVAAAGRFSEPARLEDVAALTLDDDDLDDIRRCRADDCGLKLSALEIASLQSRIRPGGDWKRTLQEGFRETVVERARAYRENGDAGLSADDEGRTPSSEFASLVESLGFLRPRVPEVALYLEHYPRFQHAAIVDSFLYWSVETLGAKPITAITHASIMRSGAGDLETPEVMVLAKQIFASHYKDASVSVTAVTAGAAADRYLVYIHRSYVDVLQGLFGSLIRRVIERRVRAEAPELIHTLRRKLETATPD